MEVTDAQSCTANNGTWAATDTTITLYPNTPGAYTVDYVINGDTLTLLDEGGENLVVMLKVTEMTDCNDYICDENVLATTIDNMSETFGCLSYLFSDGSIAVYAWDYASRGVALDIGAAAVGIYTIGDGELPYAEYYPDEETYYRAGSGIGSGWISITEITDDCVSGQFEFVAVRESDSVTVSLTGGSYSARYTVETGSFQHLETGGFSSTRKMLLLK